MFENIDYAVDEPIATITLNRPDRLNALTGPMLRELQEAVTAAEADERVVSILLTGAGRGFCAGADMGGLQAASEGQERSSITHDTSGRPGDYEMLGELGRGAAGRVELCVKDGKARAIKVLRRGSLDDVRREVRRSRVDDATQETIFKSPKIQNGSMTIFSTA